MPVPDRKRRLTAFAVAMAVLIATPLAVVASDRFNDVPDSNIFHADINAIADARVTIGCNPPENDEYCPSEFVTREQMAAFMNRLGALGPGKTPVANAATALEAGHATTADSATTAGDADTVDGLEASELMSEAFLVTDEGFVVVPPNATTEVISLELAPGSYLISARGSINSNMVAAAEAIDCTLSAGTTSQTLDNFFLNSNLNPGETEEATFMIAHTFDATGEASLSCTTLAAWSGNIIDPTITAVSVQDLTVATLGLAGEEGDPNS